MITIGHALEQRDEAYRERNKLVAAFSKLYPSHLAKHPATDTTWDPEWMWIVCVHMPVGQACWHIHDSELPMFAHLQEHPNDWDGHTTDEKYARIEGLRPEPVL